METLMRLRVDMPSPIPVRPPLARRAQTLPGSRELAGFLDPNTVTRAIEDLKRSGYRPLHARPQAPEPSGDGVKSVRGAMSR
jgi:hypothetical protein